MGSTHFHNNLLEEILNCSIIYSYFAIQAMKILLDLEKRVRREKMTNFSFFFFLIVVFRRKVYH